MVEREAGVSASIPRSIVAFVLLSQRFFGLQSQALERSTGSRHKSTSVLKHVAPFAQSTYGSLEPEIQRGLKQRFDSWLSLFVRALKEDPSTPLARFSSALVGDVTLEHESM